MENSKPTYSELENKVKELELKLSDIAKNEEAYSRALYKKILRNGELYRLLFENMLEFVIVAEVIFDEQGDPFDYRYLCMNTAAEQMSGFTSAQAVGRTYRELTPKIIPEVIATVGSVALTKHAVTSEWFSYPKKRWVQQHIFSPVDGQVVFIGIDITERKEAEALKEIEQKNKEVLINSTEDWIWSLDPEFRLIVANHSFLEVLKSAFGFNLQPGMNILDHKYIPEELILRWKNIYQKAFLGNVISMEYSPIIKDLKTYWIDLNIKPVYDKGEVVFIVCYGKQISERKEAEKVKMENQRLSALGEMAASVAHDFNNTLQAIMGNLELSMLKASHEEKILSYLNTIKTVVNDAAVRVQLLQRFGGVNQLETEYALLNLNILIKECVIQLIPLWKDNAEKTGLSISIKMELGETVFINGNDGELRSAFYNIIKNSIEAMPNGGEIIIKAEKKTETVSVTIADTGIGMDEKTRMRIFQPFFTTKGENVGRGLGMSGVYSIVKEHGGTVAVKSSEPGQGTVIELILPISQKKKIIKPEIAEVAAKLTILWVEDNDLIRINACELVEALGHNCDVVSSGNLALEYLKENKYDLVITDIGMAGMSGVQLADTIRKTYGDNMRVAVISGWDIEANNLVKDKDDIKYVLRKPCDTDQLRKLFGKIINDMKN